MYKKKNCIGCEYEHKKNRIQVSENDELISTNASVGDMSVLHGWEVWLDGNRFNGNFKKLKGLHSVVFQRHSPKEIKENAVEHPATNAGQNGQP